MMQTIPGSSRTMRPPTEADGVLTLSLTRNDEIVSTDDITTNTVSYDANVERITTATTDTAWDIATSANHLGVPVEVTLSCSATGSIADGRLMRVSDGACAVLAKTAWFTKRVDVTMLRTGGQVFDTWLSWINGSFAGDIQETTSVSLPFWRGSGLGFTAISSRHVIGCEHVAYMPPTLTLGGVTRNLVNSAYVGPANGSDSWNSDLLVGYYDGDFPSYAKVFPSTLESYLPNLVLKPVPVLLCNQFGNKLQRLTGHFATDQKKIYLAKVSPSDADIIGGDSGNPAFFVVNGEAVLLGTLTGGGAGSITSLHDQLGLINTAMTAAGGSQQLTQFDLSGYTSY